MNLMITLLILDQIQRDSSKGTKYILSLFPKNRNQFNFIIAHIYIYIEVVLEIIKFLPNIVTGPSSIPLNLLRVIADLIVFPL